MFGNHKKQLDAIQRAIQYDLADKDRGIASLRRQLRDAKILARKWRDKARYFRRERRRLRAELKLHEAPERENPGRVETSTSS